MSTLDKPTKLELLTDNLIAEAGMTALAAYLATPLASLLPVLSKSLASGEKGDRRIMLAKYCLKQSAA